MQAQGFLIWNTPQEGIAIFFDLILGVVAWIILVVPHNEQGAGLIVMKIAIAIVFFSTGLSFSFCEPISAAQTLSFTT